MTWVGNEDNFSPITWDFAQFSQAPLDVSLWLLQDLSNGKFEDRGDAVKIGRHLSAKMAVNNDGVLWGRWQARSPSSIPLLTLSDPLYGRQVTQLLGREQGDL